VWIERGALALMDVGGRVMELVERSAVDGSLPGEAIYRTIDLTPSLMNKHILLFECGLKLNLNRSVTATRILISTCSHFRTRKH
jgi:hypothetical protein